MGAVYFLLGFFVGFILAFLMAGWLTKRTLHQAGFMLGDGGKIIPRQNPATAAKPAETETSQGEV